MTIDFADEVTASGIACRKTTASDCQSTSPSGAAQASGKPTLVLVMGYGGGLRVWPATFVEALARDFDIITYDNRGTGRSIVPKDPDQYTPTIMADDLDEVVRHFGVSRFFLLGYSMGGCLALQYAHQYGEKVKALFILSSTAGGGLYVKPEKTLSEQLANPPGKTLKEMYMATFKLMYSEEAFARCEPALDAIYENSREFFTRPAGLAGHSNAFKTFDATGYLPDLKMPVTIMAGECDRLMPVQNSINLAAAIPGSKLVLVPNCEHGAHVQVESEVLDEMRALFLAPVQG